MVQHVAKTHTLQPSRTTTTITASLPLAPSEESSTPTLPTLPSLADPSAGGVLSPAAPPLPHAATPYTNTVEGGGDGEGGSTAASVTMRALKRLRRDSVGSIDSAPHKI